MRLATLLLLADGRLPSGGHAHSGGLEAQVSAGRVRDVAGLARFLRGRLATTGLVTAAFTAATCHRPGEWPTLDEALDARTPSPALRKASRAQGRALIRAGHAMWPVAALFPPAPAHKTTAPAAPPTPTKATPATPAGPAPQAGPAPRAGPVPQAGPPAHVNHHDSTGSTGSTRSAFSPLSIGSTGGAGVVAAPREPHHPVALGILAAAAGLGPAEAAVAAAHGTVTGPASAAVRLLGLDPYAVHALLAQLAGECDRIAADAAARADAPADDLPAAGAPLLDIGAELHATWEVRLFAS